MWRCQAGGVASLGEAPSRGFASLGEARSRGFASIGAADVRVLLAQELGLGRWHLEHLGALGHALTRRGAETMYVVPDPAAALQGGPLADQRVLAAPHHMPSPARRRAGATRSFVDILADAGWDDPKLLTGLARSWRWLVELTRPDLIVADFAPTLVAALTGPAGGAAAPPVVAVGLGFSLPPSELRFFPPFIQTALDDLLDDEERTLDHARVAFGTTAPALPQVFAAPQHVTSLGALDPYASLRTTGAFGPLEALAPRSPLPPRGDVFVYLTGEDPRTAPLVTALARLGRPVRGHIRDVSQAWLDALPRDGITLSRRASSMTEALAEAALVVHHGGAGLIHQATSAGRPQLLVPRYLEQIMNAQVLARRGVAASIDKVPDDAALQQIVAALSSDASAAAVEALTREVDGAVQVDAADLLAQRLLARVARRSTPAGS